LPIRLCERVPHLAQRAHLEEVRLEVKAHPPRLIIVDPLYLAARGAKGSDLYDMGPTSRASSTSRKKPAPRSSSPTTGTRPARGQRRSDSRASAPARGAACWPAWRWNAGHRTRTMSMALKSPSFLSSRETRSPSPRSGCGDGCGPMTQTAYEPLCITTSE
jgi:hypothetical protein